MSRNLPEAFQVENRASEGSAVWSSLVCCHCESRSLRKYEDEAQADNSDPRSKLKVLVDVRKAYAQVKSVGAQ